MKAWQTTPHPFHAGKWSVSRLTESGHREHVEEGVGIVKMIRAFDQRITARTHADFLNTEAQLAE